MPPAAVSRRINAERIVVVGWVRALLLQLAHPLIAAGVAEHSTFRGSTTAALSRLHQTIGAMLDLTFGDERRHADALEAIRAIHRRVHGTLPAACGCFPAGTPYSAEDPALLLWVHATLTESVVGVYERLVTPLSEMERDAYCAEGAEVAVALGARSDEVPRSWEALRAYIAAQYAAGVIAPGIQARELATALRSPVRGPAGVPLSMLVTLVAAGLLPAHVRAAYGLEWNRARALAYAAAMWTLRTGRRVSPRAIAWWAAARRFNVATGGTDRIP
jgi:uncharacterized protein (DUF2236 family)